MRLRSPIRWLGGKGHLVAKLLQYVPKHKYYAEVFGGGASLLFAKKPAPFEVYNDLDSELVNLFRVLRDEQKFWKFYRKVCLTPYSREEYYHCLDTWDKQEDDIERAYRWFVVARMSFGGGFGRGWGFVVKELNRNMSSQCSGWLYILDMLPEIHKRVMRVQIEHRDWRDLMDIYDWPYNEGFYYIDPPYLPETRKSGKYKHEMTYEDHEKLVEYLVENTDRRRIMLSGYPNELYKRLEMAGWHKVEWETACSVAGRTRKMGILGEGSAKKLQPRTEVIWFNYDIGKFLTGKLF